MRNVSFHPKYSWIFSALFESFLASNLVIYGFSLLSGEPEIKVYHILLMGFVFGSLSSPLFVISTSIFIAELQMSGYISGNETESELEEFREEFGERAQVWTSIFFILLYSGVGWIVFSVTFSPFYLSFVGAILGAAIGNYRTKNFESEFLRSIGKYTIVIFLGAIGGLVATYNPRLLQSLLSKPELGVNYYSYIKEVSIGVLIFIPSVFSGWFFGFSLVFKSPVHFLIVLGQAFIARKL